MRWLGTFLLFFVVAVCPAMAAQADPRGAPAIIDAKRLTFEKDRNLAIGEGDVVVQYKGAVLRADRIQFNNATKQAEAEGNVRLNRDGQEWVAPALEYNFDTRAMRMTEVRGFVDPVVVRGYDLKMSGSNQYAVARATVTTCDAEHPHYRLEATRSEIYPDDRVMLYNVTLRLGDVPVFWFPVMALSLQGDLQPVAVTVGNSSRWGFFILTSMTFPLAKDVELTAHLDGRTERGVGTGADLKYRIGETGKGMLRGYYASDAKPEDRGDRLESKDLPENRYRGQWQHWQALDSPWNPAGGDKDVELKLDVNKLSDPDIIDDFFAGEFRREVEPQSVLDVTKRGENYSLSVQARPQLNEFFAEVERLPEVTWSVNRTRLGPVPIYYEQDTRAGYLNNDAGDTADPLFTGHAVRLHTYHQLSVPSQWFGWLTVIPRAGMGGTFYSDAPAASMDGDRTQRAFHLLGVETSFKLSRTWPGVQNQRLQIDGLRHIAQPFANYQWVPRPDNGADEVHQFDTVRQVTLGGGDLLSLTRYSPLDFPAFNTIDAIDKQNVLRFGLRQKLQTRRDGQSWDLLEVEGWTDWRAEKEDGQHDFSDVYGTVRVRPKRWLTVDTFGRYDVPEGLLREFNTAARVSGGDRWAVGVGSRYLRDDSNLVTLDAACRLHRRWVLQTYQRMDMEDGTWESQEYVLRQETHDWLISYGVRHRSQRVKEDEVAVFFAVTLKAFPNLGLSMGGQDIASGE